MKEEENHRTIAQLKTTSLEQVRFTCMFIFKLSIYNCYNEVYKMAKKDERRRKLSTKYSTQNDVIGAGMFYVRYIIVTMTYIKWQRRMKEEENHQANRPTQLKITSLEQVCFICMFILSFIPN